jgi:hypothetical protein
MGIVVAAAEQPCRTVLLLVVHSERLAPLNGTPPSTWKRLRASSECPTSRASSRSALTSRCAPRCAPALSRVRVGRESLRSVASEELQDDLYLDFDVELRAEDCNRAFFG